MRCTSKRLAQQSDSNHLQIINTLHALEIKDNKKPPSDSLRDGLDYWAKRIVLMLLMIENACG
jgi:hypothetical protein